MVLNLIGFNYEIFVALWNNKPMVQNDEKKTYLKKRIERLLILFIINE